MCFKEVSSPKVLDLEIMALPTTYTVSLPLKKFADSIIVAQALSGFLCLQELKSSYTAMTIANKNYFKTSH